MNNWQTIKDNKFTVHKMKKKQILSTVKMTKQSQISTKPSKIITRKVVTPISVNNNVRKLIIYTKMHIVCCLAQ